MKLSIYSCVLASLIGAPGFSATYQFRGSDTLAGVTTDAITAAGLADQMQYLGGGSGLGESGIIAGTQGIAPMSRAFKAEQTFAAQAKGITLVDHIVGLDGVNIFVNADNPLEGLSLVTIAKIFTCQTTKWQQVPGSSQKGEIKAFRRNDASGTTDTFKTLAGVVAFGACVKVVNETEDIAQATENDAKAIGYAGLSAKREDNKVLAISKEDGAHEYLPTEANIRSSLYPLSRGLHIYEATGNVLPNTQERLLLEKMLDRSFLDPILVDHDFITLD